MEEHPSVAVVSNLTRLLDDAGDVPVFALAGPELDLLIESELTLISRLGAHLATAIEQAAAVGRPAELAAPSMVAWLRGRFGLTPALAHRIMREVAALRAAPLAAEAARFGAIGLEAAAAIGGAVADLPDKVGPELRREGAAVLLGFAVGSDGPALDANELRLVGRHLHEVIDPDAADLRLAQRLGREEAAVHRRRFLSITDDHDSGGVRLRGLLTAEAGASLRAVLGPLTAPRPATASEGSGEVPEVPLPDERSGGQRLVDALHEACGTLLAGGDLPTSGRSCSSPSTTPSSPPASASGPCPTVTSSRRQRSAGSPATPNSSPRSSAPGVNRWTWAAPPGQRPELNAKPSSSATGLCVPGL